MYKFPYFSLSSFPTEILHAFLSSRMRATCSGKPLTLYVAESTSYEAPHYPISPNFLSQIFTSTPCSQIISICILPLMSETMFHINTKLQAES
jgi:hypothetical protein